MTTEKVYISQKHVLELYKTNKYAVLSFNGKSDQFEYAYTCLNILDAMEEIIKKTSLGFKILILDGAVINLTTTLVALEAEKGSKLTYDDLLHLALKDGNSQELRHS